MRATKRRSDQATRALQSEPQAQATGLRAGTTTRSLALGALMAAALIPTASAQVAVKGKTVHTMAGPPITNGVVVIRDGKIVAVGTADQVTIPQGFRVLEAEVVTPGLVDAHSTVGLTGIYNQDQDQDQLEHSDPIQPELRAFDAYNAQEVLIKWVRSFGVTTVHTGHAPGELISGQTMIAKTTGNTVDDAKMVETAAVAVTLGEAGRRKENKPPGTRGKMMAMLRGKFIEAGEYQRPANWLDKGWKTVQNEGWRVPLYWEKSDQGWTHYTLGGRRPVNPDEPVVHVSYFEADAYARWKGMRLPSEHEWEVAAREADAPDATFVETLRCHPYALSKDAPSGTLHQMFGEVWEWTMSPYSPYPGYAPAAGAVGEYNGKWMVDQMVLRGGSCATSESHIRPTYRNFFPADARWQFMGIRLARDAR